MTMLPKQLQPSPAGAKRPNPERDRLIADMRREANWKRWGPYLSERQWGTVREDYSADGDCWRYFTHDQARSRAYRWGEDGLLGICDRECRLCFALALWNGKDPILKERLFGLTGPEGNHGEDVKEQYHYLASTPTHSYLRAAYMYPQGAYPYDEIVAENHRRTRDEPEYELDDTSAFDDGHWQVEIEYAKAGPEDVCVRVHVTNRGKARAKVHVLPTLWFRNTWAWGSPHEGGWGRPVMALAASGAGAEKVVRGEHATLGKFAWTVGRASSGANAEMLFTENETNTQRLFGLRNTSAFVKDAFHDRVVRGDRESVNGEMQGTKAAAWYELDIKPGETVTIPARLSVGLESPSGKDAVAGSAFDRVFAERITEMDRFFSEGRIGSLKGEEREIALQAYAGLLWSKQFYQYVVADWLDGDAKQPDPPAPRKARGARNTDWRHVYARDVILMPDKWEYPWFAAWDLAFHCVAVSHVDPELAKSQLLLMMREWYMHPSGAIPAYEFAFGDVNPPVHAWACWRVYKITGRKGERDRVFLARAFHKLLLNFTWWVNRKDPDGKNVFGGGFLGLDNIGVFDRSRPLPTGGHLEQADGTAWMAFFCGTMLSIALELAKDDPAYEDVASKFFEHFVAIVDAMNTLGGTGLWDEADGFYYDQLRIDSSHPHTIPLRVRSLVGIIPILACEVLEEHSIEKLPGFMNRLNWFLNNRPELARYVSFMTSDQGHEHCLLAIPSRERLTRVLKYLLDEQEFLSPYGVRSLSKFHAANPYVFDVNGNGGAGGAGQHRVDYVPGESNTGLFGGNSNWRGPIWMPLNYLIVEALERYHHFYGEALRVDCAGKKVTLDEAAGEIRRRLVSLFMPCGSASAGGHRPCHGGLERYGQTGDWKNLVLFHEYFHAETGKGLGASHQTGWTALIAPMLKDLARKNEA